jgi:hypothetical protein
MLRSSVMELLDDAVAEGLKKAGEALQRQKERRLSKPVNASIFSVIFSQIFTKEGYGFALPLTKIDYGMLKQFILRLRKGDWEEEQIREVASLIVTKWHRLAGKTLNTDLNRKLTMPLRPNLRSFLSCKMEALYSLYEEGEDEFIISPG